MEKRNQKILILALLLGFILALSGRLNSQSCYVRLSDASGITPTQYQIDALESAACRLRDSLPTVFQDSFKVYDFGFYLHNENMVGGYPEIFQAAITQVETQSQYYLLFGKQTDKSGIYTKFWVALKLPNQDIFYCIDQLSPNLREDLTAKFGIIANAIHDSNDKSYFRYHEAETATIDSLRNYVVALKDCCIPPGQQRRGASCTSCAFTQTEFSARLKGLGLVSRSFAKIIDTNPSPSQGEEIGYSVEYPGGAMDLDVVMTSVKAAIHSRFPSVSIKIYPFNYGDDCSDYQSIREQFLNENVDIGILIGVVGENGNAGSVHWQTISRDIAVVSAPQAVSDTIYYFDKNGKYLRKEAGQGGTRGIWLDKCGQGCNYEFSFADPIPTPRTLTTDTIREVSPFDTYLNTDEPMLNKVMVMNKDMIFSRLAASTAFDPVSVSFPFSAEWGLMTGSSGWTAPFDFSTKNYFADRQNILFITDDGEHIVGHNYRNMGNFLWGAATYIMGVWEWAALAGAHLNNLNSDGGWDSDDDQWSIQLGRNYAKKMDWKTIYGGRQNIFKN